jgi:hypothetical protein
MDDLFRHFGLLPVVFKTALAVLIFTSLLLLFRDPNP